MQNGTAYVGQGSDGSSIRIEFGQGGKYAYVSFDDSDSYGIYTFYDRSGY